MQKGLLSQAKKSAATLAKELEKRRQAHEQVQQELHMMLEGIESSSERVAALQQEHARLSEQASSAQKEYDSLFEEVWPRHVWLLRLARCKLLTAICPSMYESESSNAHPVSHDNLLQRPYICCSLEFRLR
jgi:uncharacterized small protein (DUF1192 family)